MQKQYLYIAAILVAITAAIVIARKHNITPESYNGTGSINVGFVAPLTGTAAAYGEEARNAAVLAVKQINEAGGVNGKSLNLIVEDGKCEGTAAANAWQKLAQGQGLDIILGGHCSTETVTLGALAGSQHKLLLADITSANQVPYEGEWVFRNSPPNSQLAAKLADYAYQKGYRQMALITELKEFPKDFSASFKNQFQSNGGTIVLEEQIAPSQTDLRSVVIKLQQYQYDAVLASFQGPETMGLFAKQMQELGVEKTLIFNPAYNNKKFLEASNGYIPKDMYGVGPYLNVAQPKTADFMKAYEKEYKTGINFTPYYIAATYDMVFRLKEALTKCGNEDANCLREQFKQTKQWTGSAGAITYGDQSIPNVPAAAITINNGQPVYTPFQ